MVEPTAVTVRLPEGVDKRDAKALARLMQQAAAGNATALAEVRTLFERSGERFAQGEYWQRQQDRAHRRYLTSIRTLAQVRRLLVPAMQVNVAENQINVAG